jgi:hypothetical protein
MAVLAKTFRKDKNEIITLAADPFVKVKVFICAKDGKMKRHKFETKTIWKSLTPVWMEK